MKEKILGDFLKRICETNWHEEIKLKKHEECPRCQSKAYHLIIRKCKM